MNDPATPPGLPDEAKDRNFVTALARGLDVLRAFRPGEAELTNTDFSDRTGLPKPTVSRLTHTLCRLEYLVANPATGAYRLGAGVIRLGYGVLAGMDVVERAKPIMRELRDGPNSYITVALGERHRLEVLYIAVETSRENVSLTMHVGSRLPLFHSALGRSILAVQDEAEIDAILRLVSEERPETLEESRRICAEARAAYQRDGFCVGYGEWRRDVNGISVPVFTPGGSRVLGLNVGGPSFHVKKKQLEGHYARQLAAATKTLSLRG